MADRARLTPAARYVSCGVTDQGSVRKNNEDVVHTDDERGIYFVIDGMGGHAAGERAAAIAAERLIGRLERRIGVPEQRLREAIALANNAVYEAAQGNPEWRGMACVLTVAILEDGEAIVGHVGDSRLYKITRDGMEKVTDDHSPVGEMEDKRQISEAEAMRHPRRNEVYRDVGSQPHEPDDRDFVATYRFPMGPGIALLLCSDGLTDAVPKAGIEEVLRSSNQPKAIVERLVQLGAANGKDNVSVILVAPEGSSTAEKSARRVRAALDGKSGRRKSPVTERSVTETPAPPIAPATPTPRPLLRTEAEDPRPVSTGYFENATLFPPVRPSRWPSVAKAALWMVIGGGLTVGGLYYFDLLPFQKPQAPPIVINQRFTVRPGRAGAIAEAVAKAHPGDEIELTPGEYHEPIRLHGGLTLKGSGATIRLPRSAAPEPAITVEDGDKASVTGVKIIGEARSEMPIGILVRGGRVDIKDVDVSGARMAGIEFNGNASGAVSRSTIHDNGGPGILLRDNAAPDLLGNRVLNNGHTPGALRPGIQIESSTKSRIEANTIVSNGAQAIWMPVEPGDDLLVKNVFSAAGLPGRKRDVKIVPRQEPIP